MQMAGDRTTGVPLKALADEILVNRDGSTGRMAVADLALQLTGSGALADSLLRASYGIRGFQTWSWLSTITQGNVNGALAVVPSDPGTHTDPLGQYTVPNSGMYQWVEGHNSWHWIADYKDGTTVLNHMFGITRNVGMQSPIRIDRNNRLGGGAAVYVPRTIFLRLPVTSVVKNGNVANAEAEEFAGHVKFSLSSSSPTGLLCIYYSTATNEYVAFDNASDPTPNSSSATLVPIVFVWRAGVVSPFGFPVAENDEFGLKSRLWPQALAFFRSPILDTVNFYGGGSAVYVPRRFFIRRAGTEILVDPPTNDESSEVAGFSKLPLDNLNGVQVLLYNHALRKFELTTYSAGLNLRENLLDQVYIIGTIWGSTITSEFEWVRAGSNLGENQCAFGKANIDLIPRRFADTVITDITEPNLIALGFTRGGVSAQKMPLLGMDFQTPVGGARCFFRCYLETNMDDQYNAPSVYIWNSDQSSITRYSLVMEKRISARAARFSATVSAPSRDDLKNYWIGSATGTAIVKVTGVQHHMSTRAVEGIALSDYPTKDASIYGDVSDFAMAYPPHMFLVSGRPMPFFPSNIMKEKSELLAAGVTFFAAPPSPGKRPVVLTGRETILIDGKDCGTTGGIEVRRYGGMLDTRFRIPLTIHAAPAQGTGIVRYLAIGDSLTDREQPMLWAAKMQDLGYDARTIGTMENGSATYKGEGRGSREWADFIYEHTDMGTPVPAGSEAAYLAMSNADRLARMPFLKTPTTADKENKAGFIYNGYIFDMRFYLNRFGFPDPDFVTVNLIRNDISQQNPTETLAQLERGFAVIYAQTREALPNAHIGFVISADARSVSGDADWVSDRWSTAILRQIQLVAEKRTAGDGKVWVVPVYAHMSTETGYGVTVQASETQGTQRLTISDYVHFYDHGRHAYAEPIVAWAHALKAGA